MKKFLIFSIGILILGFLLGKGLASKAQKNIVEPYYAAQKAQLKAAGINPNKFFK